MYGCNDTGFEMLEFVHEEHDDTTIRDTAFSSAYIRPGICYISLTDPDVECVTKRVVKAGGSILGEISRLGPLDAKIEAQYLRDPWGNVIKVLNVAFETAVNGFCWNLAQV